MVTWIDAVKKISEQAQAKMHDALHGCIQRATALLLDHGVWFEEDGRCLVRSSDKQRWYPVNGTCSYEDYPVAPEHLCKHRLAKAIYRRAGELLTVVALVF